MFDTNKFIEHSKKFGKEVLNVLNTPVIEIRLSKEEEIPEVVVDEEEVQKQYEDLSAKIEMLQRKFNGELFA